LVLPLTDIPDLFGNGAIPQYEANFLQFLN